MIKILNFIYLFLVTICLAQSSDSDSGSQQEFPQLCPLFRNLEACLSNSLCEDGFNCIPDYCSEIPSPACDSLMPDIDLIRSHIYNMNDSEKQEEMKVMQCLYFGYPSFVSQFNFCYNSTVVSNTSISTIEVLVPTGKLVSSVTLSSTGTFDAKVYSVFHQLQRLNESLYKFENVSSFDLSVNFTDINSVKGHYIGDAVELLNKSNEYDVTICIQNTLESTLPEGVTLSFVSIENTGSLTRRFTIFQDGNRVCAPVNSVGIYLPAIIEIDNQDNSDEETNLSQYLIVVIVIAVIVVGSFFLIVAFIVFEVVLKIRRRKPVVEVTENNILGGARSTST